jgi:hypothetical protein
LKLHSFICIKENPVPEDVQLLEGAMYAKNQHLRGLGNHGFGKVVRPNSVQLCTFLLLPDPALAVRQDR